MRSGLLLLLLLVMSCASPRNRIPLEICNISGHADTVTVLYRFTAEDCLCTDEPVIVCPAPWSVTVNDTPAPGTFGRHFIGGLVHEGENFVEIKGAGKIPRVSLVLEGRMAE